MNSDIEINGNMELSKYSPLEQYNEDVMEENVDEKAKSRSQQKFFGMVDAYKKGEMPNASPAIKKAADGMSMKQVKDFAKTKHKGLPNHIDESGLRKIVSESIQKIINESFKSRIIKNFVDKYGMGSPNPALSEITDDMIFNSDIVTEYPSWAITNENRWKYVVYRGNNNVWLILTMTPEFKNKFGYDYFDWGKQQPYLNGTHDKISRRKWDAHKNDGDYTYQTRPRFQNPLSRHYTSKDFSNDMNRYINESVNGEFRKQTDGKTSRWTTRLTENKLRNLIRETVQMHLVDVLGKYTQGKTSSKEANKAIMDLANSSNKKKLDEELNARTLEYLDRIRNGECETFEWEGKVFSVPPQIKRIAQQTSEKFGVRVSTYIGQNERTIYYGLLVDTPEDCDFYRLSKNLTLFLLEYDIHYTGWYNRTIFFNQEILKKP